VWRLIVELLAVQTPRTDRENGNVFAPERTDRDPISERLPRQIRPRATSLAKLFTPARRSVPHGIIERVTTMPASKQPYSPSPTAAFSNYLERAGVVCIEASIRALWSVTSAPRERREP